MHRRRSNRVRVLLILTGMIWLPRAVRAAEPYLAFTSALRERGYGDVAVEYLLRVSGRADTPAAVKDVLDLELSNSYRVWSEQATDPSPSQDLRRKADTHFEHFNEQHPKHAGIAQAYIERGDQAFRRGERIWKRGGATAGN